LRDLQRRRGEGSARFQILCPLLGGFLRTARDEEHND
jgi:hypothetical protein